MLYTEEPVAQSFTLNDRIEIGINISTTYSNPQFIGSLAWYHNGTELTSDDRINIDNNGTSLTISNLVESDAGKYEVKVNSTNLDGGEICDRNFLPMLENLAVHAPITFLLQESNFPIYNPEDAVLNYPIPPYQGIPTSFINNNIFKINAPAIFNNNARINEAQSKDAILNRDMNIFQSTITYDDVTAYSFNITYNNTDDVAGYYTHIAFTSIDSTNISICPGYFDYFSIFDDIPILALHWNITLHSELILHSSLF